MRLMLDLIKNRYLQTLVTLEGHLEEHGESLDAVFAWYRSHREQIVAYIQAKMEYYDGFPDCPECHHKLAPLPVNTWDGDRVGGDYTFQWACTSGKCDYEHFNSDPRDRWQPPDKPNGTPHEQRLFGAFRKDDLEAAARIYGGMKHYDLTMEHVRDQVRANTVGYRGKRTPPRPQIPCPDCGGTMNLRIGDDNDSYWCCPCAFSVYDPRPVALIIEKWREDHGQ